MPRKRKSPFTGTADRNSARAEATADADHQLSINVDFAERYDAAKRKEILAQGPIKTLDDDSSSESAEEEDEHAVLLTKKIDRLVYKTLTALRSKDPIIYNKETKFFDDDADCNEVQQNDGYHLEGGESAATSEEEVGSDDEPVAGWDTIAKNAENDTKKLTLKDYVRDNLLRDGKLSDSDDEGADLSRYSADAGSVNHKLHRNGHYLSQHAKPMSGSTGKVIDEDIKLRDGVVKHDRDERNGRDDDGKEDDDDDDDEMDDEFFKMKGKSELELLEEDEKFERFMQKESITKRHQRGDEILLHAYLERETPDEKERFLQDFVLNNGWLDRSAGAAPSAGDYAIEVDHADLCGRVSKISREDPKKEAKEGDVSDSEFEEKVDEFEYKYNFRFEEPDGTKVVSFARNVEGSLRRPDDRRKRARDARKERKNHEKLLKTEEIKQLKNLKKREIEARLLALREAAGDGVDFVDIDLDEDFDPEQFSKQMDARFGDDYYNAKDRGMRALAKDGVVVATDGMERREGESDVADDVNRLVESYYNLDYEDIIGGAPVRFNYKRVEPDSFGMDPAEILALEDKDLNRKASLKYLAPYRKKKNKMSNRSLASNSRRFGRTAVAGSELSILANVHTERVRKRKRRKKVNIDEGGPSPET